MERRPRRWPGLLARELDDFFRELRRTVLELEDAWARDALAPRLRDPGVARALGPGLLRCYEALAAEPRPDDPQGRRRATVFALLDQARAEVFAVDTWLHGRLVVPDGAGGWTGTTLPADDVGADAADGADDGPFGAPMRVLAGLPEGGRIALRLDEVLARRFWGVSFVFDDPRVTDELANLLADRTARHLQRDLRDLQKILRRILRAGDPERFPELVPERESRAFEQLMIDLLNVDGPHAQAAPLAEDYSQKTDLRVRYPGLQRRRGARVQVTRIVEPSRHLDKVFAIRRHNEFVILSPLALARFVDAQVHAEPGAPHVLGADELAAFWDALPGRPMDVDGLARTLRDVLCAALAGPCRDPRGPAACVPSGVAHVLRAYVRHEAARTTSELRAWEAVHGPYRAGRDGRLHPVARGRAARRDDELARALLVFAERHPPGTRVRARVERVEQRAATLRLLDGDLPAHLPREELSWGHAPSHTGDVLRPGDELDVALATVRPDEGRALVSLRATRADPWADGDALPRPGERAAGRVVHQAPYGLFVELRPDVVGLLHASALPPPDADGRWTSTLPLGAAVDVRVERVEPETRRVALSLAQAAADDPRE